MIGISFLKIISMSVTKRERERENLCDGGLRERENPVASV
jgi:hypothetical protein